MMFKKSFYFMMLLFTSFMFFTVNFYKFYNLYFYYFCMPYDLFNNYNISFMLDTKSMIFMLMVSFVTLMVIMFSQFYMENYSNKKFLFLVMIFFSSMMMLSLSSCSLVLVMGWDGLGISSICLVMFYYNKITMFNSFLTMLFNRMGDMFFLYFMTTMFKNYSNYYFFYDHSFNLLLLFIILCSFTKSAQFPMSVWLPAAMAAPTPISAMVHSSTLVTAGIFIILKFSHYLNVHLLLEFLCYFNLVTFFLGGLMASIEMDMKKIIAFSTMSQISMIMFFISINFIIISMSHMFYHALFKTFLFCYSGLLFLMNFSDQFFKNIHSSINVYNFMFFLSVYSMSGLMLSSSFYSKDVILEYFCSCYNSFFFFILIFCSVFTILYCSYLLKTVIFSFKPNFSIGINNFKNKFKFIFFFFMVYIGNIFIYLFLLENNSFINMFDLILMMLIFLIPMIYQIKIHKFLLSMVNTVSFMKLFSFNLYSKVFHKFNFIFFNDQLLFKFVYLNKFMKFEKNMFMYNYNLFSIIFILTLFMSLIW